MKKTKHKKIRSSRRNASRRGGAAKHSQSERHEHGFTLVEVIIALTILAVSLTGLLGMSVFTLSAASKNDEWTNARIIAASRLEEITALPFDTLQATAGSAPYETSTISYNGKTYNSWVWYVRQGSASDPLRVVVVVGDETSTSASSPSAVSLSTLKTYYL